MPRTADGYEGPRDEEAIDWEVQSSDPSVEFRMQFVQDKGLLILEDGVVHGVGESRDNVWQGPVDDRAINSPPGSPTTGYRVIVGNAPTGAFIGHSGEIAQWSGSAWAFTTPKHGTIVNVKDENEPYKQTATSTPWVWTLVDSGGGGGLPTPTEVGQFLYSYDGATFEICKPVVTDDGFIVTDQDGHQVVINDY